MFVSAQSLWSLKPWCLNKIGLLLIGGRAWQQNTEDTGRYVVGNLSESFLSEPISPTII